MLFTLRSVVHINVVKLLWRKHFIALLLILLLVVCCFYRSSHWRCSVREGVLRDFTKFTKKHLRRSLSFNKVASVRPATLFKKRLWHRCFPVNYSKFLRTPFLQNTSGRLLPEAATRDALKEKMFLEISQNSQENTCARVHFFKKLQGPATLLKKRPWYMCFPVNFSKFLRTPFLQNTSRRVLMCFCFDFF